MFILYYFCQQCRCRGDKYSTNSICVGHGTQNSIRVTSIMAYILCYYYYHLIYYYYYWLVVVKKYWYFSTLLVGVVL